MTRANKFKVSIKLLTGKEIKVGESYCWKDGIFFTIKKFLRKGILINLHYLSYPGDPQIHKKVKVSYDNAHKLFHGTNSR